MAGSHDSIRFGNDAHLVDDTIAVIGIIESIDYYSEIAKVQLPRWGLVDALFFYHCKNSTNTQGGSKAFSRKDNVIVLVKGGRVLDKLYYHASDFLIVGHHKNTGRETIKQPLSCVWETFALAWVYQDEITGQWLYDHPSSELLTQAICIKHKWKWGASGHADRMCDYSDGAWGNWYGQYIYNWPQNGGWCYADWRSSWSWEGDDPVKCNYINIKCGGWITVDEDEDDQNLTNLWVRVTDDYGNYAYLYLFKEPKYELEDDEYDVGVGDLILNLSSYGITGKVTQVRIECATKPGSNPIREIYFYIYSIDLFSY